MAGTAALDDCRVARLVHLNRAREPELAVLQHDGVLVLRDAIDGAVERPVEDDARGLAPHARVVLGEEHRELLGALFTLRRQLGALNHSRPAAARSSRTTDPPLSWLVLTGGTQRHQRAAAASRIGHHQLLRGPVAGDVGFAGWPPRCTLRCSSGWSTLRELPVPIHALAVLEHDR